MKRKVVSVILCGTMVLGMVTGCGSSKGYNQSVSEQIRDFKSASGSR